MKKIVFITPRDAEFGFALTGLTHHAVETGEAEDTLRGVMDEPDNGLIIVDERLVRGQLEERLAEVEHGWDGILLFLPSPELLPPEVEDYAARSIRRAIGYHVRLNV